MFSGSKYAGFGANDAPAGMLDALVDGQDGYVAGAREPAGVEEPLQAAEHARRTIGTPRRRGRRSRDPAGAGCLAESSGTGASAATASPPSSASIRLESFARCNSTYCGHVAPPTGDPTTGYSKSSTTALGRRVLDKFVDRQRALGRFDVGEPPARQRIARREQRAAILIGNDRDRIAAKPPAPRP